MYFLCLSISVKILQGLHKAGNMQVFQNNKTKWFQISLWLYLCLYLKPEQDLIVLDKKIIFFISLMMDKALDNEIILLHHEVSFWF